MNSSRSRTPVIRAIVTMLVVAALAAAAVGCGSDSKSKDNAKDKDNQTTAKKADSSSTTSKGSTSSPTSASGSTATSSAKPSGGSEFCSKITDQEASDVLGVPIERRESPGNLPKGVGGACIKGSPRQADITKAAFVSFSAFRAAGPFASFDKVKGQFKDAKVLNGLGDQALFVPTGGLVFAFAKGMVFQVQVYKLGKVGTESDAVDLAHALLSRV